MTDMNDASGPSRSSRSLAELSGVWLRLLRAARLSSRKKKPGELIYGLDDVPPPLIIANTLAPVASPTTSAMTTAAPR